MDGNLRKCRRLHHHHGHREILRDSAADERAGHQTPGSPHLDSAPRPPDEFLEENAELHALKR